MEKSEITMEKIEIPNLTDSQKLYKAFLDNLMSVNTGLNDVQMDVKELNKVVLLGNGDLPLREQVRNHDSFIKDWKYWIRLIGGALVLQTLAFLTGILIAVVKFLPLLESLAKKP